MKLLFVNQYYWPDSAATAQMLTDLCEHLAEHGHDVHVLCSRAAYDAGSSTRRKLPRSETRNGVRIHRISATGFGKRRIIGQAIDFISFHLLVGLKTLLSAYQYDAIVTLTTPPLIGLYGALAQVVSRTKHVTWVMDLHPDCEFELGMMRREQLLPKLANALNGLMLRRADANVVLGDYMGKRLLAKGVEPSRIVSIPVWGHDHYEPSTDRLANPLREQLGIGDKFVVMYSGNAGLIHTFTEVCEAALRLRDDPRFVFLFIGGGRRLDEIKAFREKHGLTNLRQMSYLPRERIGDSLGLADAHLITLRERIAGVSVPCKLYGIMAAARPSIFIGPRACETAEAIEASDAGRVVRNDDVEGLIRVLNELVNDLTIGRQLGQNARRAYEQTYNAARCGEIWRATLEGLLAETSSSSLASSRPKLTASSVESTSQSSTKMAGHGA